MHRTRFSLHPPLCLALLLLLQTGLFGQEPEKGINQPSRLNISYLGNNLWNPGLNIGLEHNHASTQRVNNKNKSRQIEKLLVADLGFFHDFSKQTPVFLNAGFSKRSCRENRLFTQWSISPIGLMRSFLPETWSVQAGAKPEQVRFAGRWYYAPMIAWGIGREAAQSKRAWFMEVSSILLMPYNRFIMPLINIKLGYRLPLNKALGPTKTHSE